MITVTNDCARVLDTRSYTLSCRASITLGGTVLVDDLPVASGTEEFDDTLRVPERVVIKVPRIVNGVDLIPTAATSPLAPYGQRLHIKLGVGINGGQVEWLDRGEFLIHDIALSGESVTVTAVGLLALPDEARLVTPFRPTGTLTTALRALLEPALTVIVDPAVTALDRSVPSDINQDEDRLGALEEILTAWPARAQMHPAGYLQILPADYYPAGSFVQRYNFGLPDGTRQDLANIAEVAGAITRDGLINTVVARGQAFDGTQVQGVAYDKTPGGPTSLRSNFNPLPVPYFYFSPLLTTAQQCQDAAISIIRRKAGLAAQRLQMTCVPDPRFVGNDKIHYRYLRSTDWDSDAVAVVEKLVLPYTAESGPMLLTLREEVA
jgi:hypothetical protein